MIKGVISGQLPRPRRVLLYGTHGIGKSTWAAGSPKPLFLQTEDGLDDIGVDRTPKLRTTHEVASWLIALSGEDNTTYQTVVIDTLDWLERLIWTATCEENGKKSIEDFGYGKGYQLAAKRWDVLLTMLDACRERGLNVILLAHARIERFSPPDGDPYDRWVPDLHKAAAPKIQEWCDEVLFATYRVTTVTRDEGFGRKQTRAIDDTRRVVFTCESPTHMAKRRIDLPDEIALSWSAYQDAWPAKNIKGVVTDGSSKTKGK